MSKKDYTIAGHLIKVLKHMQWCPEEGGYEVKPLRPTKALRSTLLRDKAFTPAFDCVARMTTWVDEKSPLFKNWVNPRALALENTPLWEPLLHRVCLVAKSRKSLKEKTRIIKKLEKQYLKSLHLFLLRLQRDTGKKRAKEFRLHLPIQRLYGRQGDICDLCHIHLRILDAKKNKWIYKARLMQGEQLFLSKDTTSVFSKLNTLTAPTGTPQFPTIDVFSGKGEDGWSYGWMKWLDPPKALKTIRQSAKRQLRGLVLTEAESQSYWYSAGCLAAVSIAFGFEDLHFYNMAVTRQAHDNTLAPVPIDLERFFVPLESLNLTGIVQKNNKMSPAFTEHPTWMSAAGWRFGFCYTDNRLSRSRPMPSRQRMLAQENYALVVNPQGEMGYRSYVPAFLRGLFDAWLLVLLHRTELRDFMAQAFLGAKITQFQRPPFQYMIHMWKAMYGNAQKDKRGAIRALSRDEKRSIDEFEKPSYYLELGTRKKLRKVAIKETEAKGIYPSPPVVIRHRKPSWEILSTRRISMPRLGHHILDALRPLVSKKKVIHVEDSKYGVSGSYGKAHLDLCFEWHEAKGYVKYRSCADGSIDCAVVDM